VIRTYFARPNSAIRFRAAAAMAISVASVSAWCIGATLAALTLRTVFRLAYRQAEGLIGSIISLLGLTLQVPHHTTLSRRSAALAVPRPQPTATDCDARPVHLLVDSTG
jgi:hypothetical protein